MTLFEYLATASSLLYSIAALRVLGGLPGALAPGKRYPLHLALSFNLLLLILLSFWTFWSLRDVEWTFRGFTLALFIPGLLYYCAAVLVPENPERVASWREHYFEMRRRWYAGFALWGLSAGVSASFNLGMPLDHRARSVHLAAILGGAAGMMFDKQRPHAVLVSLIAIVLILGVLNVDLPADWLANP